MKRCIKANSSAASIQSATQDYSQYGLKEVERELINRIGSRVAADPAILVNLGTGESGMIAEIADGDIVLDNLDTSERVWGAQNVIEAVLTSWDKSIEGVIKSSTDNRLASTSKRYKGYLIRLNNRTESYDIYDSHRELEETGFKSIEHAKDWIDEYTSVYQDSVYPNI